MTNPKPNPTPKGSIDQLLSAHAPVVTAPSSPKTAGGVIELFDIDALDDNDDQNREPLDPDKIAELAATIARLGLLQNILVRVVGGRHQIVCGHRRRAAFRHLRDQAATPEEKERWGRIPARVIEASDEDAAAMCLIENLGREDLSPVEEGAGYARMMEKYGYATAKALAQRLQLDEKRITRRLRLYQAPAYIREALAVGLRVNPPDPSTGEEAKRKETRKLNPDAALEFLRLHAHYLKKHPGLEPKKADPRPIADVKAQPHVERALAEAWTREKIRTFVDRAIEGRAHPEATEPGEERDAAPLWERKGDRMVIHLSRLSASSKEQREQLLREVQQAVSGSPSAAA